VRAFAIFAPTFWTGRTGREIRAAGPVTQLVAAYLISSPMSNMIGLYRLPIPMIAHDLAIPEKQARGALTALNRLGFAHYDEEAEVLWVLEMARFQVGEMLKPGDKRIVGVMRQLAEVKTCPLARAFYAKYRAPFNLPDAAGFSGPSEAPSIPLRSQDQEQDHDQEQEQERDDARLARSSSGFERFWQLYPKKVGKDAAASAWRKKKCEAVTTEVLTGLSKQMGYLTRETGRFIPNPQTWINSGRWMDEVSGAHGNGTNGLAVRLVEEAQRTSALIRGDGVAK
jgi:hypothetical protein